MALLEPNARSPSYTRDATNVLGAIINRSEASRTPLGDHVNNARTYQPLIEGNQEARLRSIISRPEFQQLSDLAERRSRGDVQDWTGGATHYLAPAREMLELEAKEPWKYRDWGPRGSNWSTYDQQLGDYADKLLEDGSHAFLRGKEFGGLRAARATGGPVASPAISGADAKPDWPNVVDAGVNRAIPVAADTNPFSTENLLRSMASGGGFGAQAGNAIDAANNTAMQEQAHLNLINSGGGAAGGGATGGGGLLSSLFGGGEGGGGGDLFSALGSIGSALGGGGGGDSPPPLRESPMIGQLKKPVFDAKQLAAALAKRNKLGSDVQAI